MKKVFKIKLTLSNGRQRDMSGVLVEVLKKMKLTKFLEFNAVLSYDEVELFKNIETQIEKQYDCNKREIAFEIDVNN